LIYLDCSFNNLITSSANTILNALPVLPASPRGECFIIVQQSGPLSGLVNISSKNWIVA
jgi:hypothetical protein